MSAESLEEQVVVWGLGGSDVVACSGSVSGTGLGGGGGNSLVWVVGFWLSHGVFSCASRSLGGAVEAAPQTGSRSYSVRSRACSRS